MKNQYKIIKPEDKKNIKIVDNKDEFYLDINGTKIEGIKKYNIIRENEKSPILELHLYLDNVDFQECLKSKIY